MKPPRNIDVLFVAGFGPIVRDLAAGRKFYGEALGLPLKEEPNGYMHTGAVDGVKHFALWPLEQAAESCFGRSEWPGDVPVPQAWLEFDVADIEKATAELKSQGYKLLVANRKEPWGQIVTRLLGPEGLLVGVTYTPAMRGGK
jgi:catechol 2,3-dioxygenase-like lactoylglutathione lyase family enzyme